MQQAVRKYLMALEAGDADKAASLFVADGWVQSPFLGRLPVREYVNTGRIESIVLVYDTRPVRAVVDNKYP